MAPGYGDSVPSTTSEFCYLETPVILQFSGEDHRFGGHHVRRAGSGPAHHYHRRQLHQGRPGRAAGRAAETGPGGSTLRATRTPLLMLQWN